jgi:hypothetical protein
MQQLDYNNGRNFPSYLENNKKLGSRNLGMPLKRLCDE